MNVHKFWRIGIAAASAVILLAALAGTVIVYFGTYNVTATREHPAIVYDFLHLVMRRSVGMRANGIRPPDLEDASRIRTGFLLFRAHCVQCHGAPGVSPQPFAFGLRPLPPSLIVPAREWPASHVYWVVRNGVRMTAMPAWEYRFNEQEMWDVTAFVEHLPDLSPAEYRRWDEQFPQDGAPPTPPEALANRSGNPVAGRRAVDGYLCATCHQIPGVVGARNTVGPPLGGIATRAYIAGSLKNSPENMLRWLRDPQKVKPGTAMPNLHIREQDVRDIAAFLYTLDSSN